MKIIEEQYPQKQSRPLKVGMVLVVVALATLGCQLATQGGRGSARLEISVPDQDGVQAQQEGEEGQELFIHVVEVERFQRMYENAPDEEFGGTPGKRLAADEVGITRRQYERLINDEIERIRIPHSGGGGAMIWTREVLRVGVSQSVTVRNLRGDRRYIAYAIQGTRDEEGNFDELTTYLGAGAVSLAEGESSTISLVLEPGIFQYGSVFDEEGLSDLLPVAPPVEPAPNPFDFDWRLYEGTGLANITVTSDTRVTEWEDISLNRGDIFRFPMADDGDDYLDVTPFILTFSDADDPEAPNVAVWLFESLGADEPSRSFYPWADLDWEDPDEDFSSVSAGTMYAVMVIEPFEGEDGVVYSAFPIPGYTPQLSAAGFDGRPSREGTFTLQLSGTAFVDENGEDDFEPESMSSGLSALQDNGDVQIEGEQVDISIDLEFEYGDQLDLGDEAQDEEYEVGDTGPAGGHIFYVDEEEEFDWTYLEAAPAATEWTGVEWAENTQQLGPDAQGFEIGDGLGNTERIVTALGGETASAAALTDELTVNGYDDWFMPSEQELLMMYENLHLAGNGDFALDGIEGETNNYYWSSTEAPEEFINDPGDSGYVLEFNSGPPSFSLLKSAVYDDDGIITTVRAARRF